MIRNLLLSLFRFLSREKSPYLIKEDAHSNKEKSGLLKEREQELLHSILEFQDTIVREVMVPRIHMDCIDIHAGLSQILDLVIEKGHTRLPVFKGSIDNIIGILNVKDLISIWRYRKLIILQDLIRPAYFVPETKKISELLREFQKHRMHMAIVLDEYGGTAGLVTMEDLIEEIVGDISDEYDREEEPIQYQPNGSIIMRADYSIHEANEKLDLGLPENDFESIGGFVIHLLGRLPETGERIPYRNLIITVLESNDRRILKLKIKKINGEGTPS